jgi:hypothetical protein
MNDLGSLWKEAPMAYFMIFWHFAWRQEETSVRLPGLLDEIQSRGIQNMKEG